MKNKSRSQWEQKKKINKTKISFLEKQINKTEANQEKRENTEITKIRNQRGTITMVNNTMSNSTSIISKT